MTDTRSKFTTNFQNRGIKGLFVGLLAICMSLTASAQGGPVPARTDDASLGPPTIPVQEIIQKLGAREADLKAERNNFTYTQTYLVQTLDEDNRVDGEYRLKSEIDYDPNGKRYEKVTYAPQSTLKLDLTREDLDDLAQLFPLVLPTSDLPYYDIKYVDHKPLDELATYVFDLTPKTIGKKDRFFQGRIWVDDKDFQIVKVYGKPVGYAKKNKAGEQVFPHFETFRENIEGKYWFPTYTRADEMLHFGPGNDVHFRMTVKYEDYKRYGVTVKITPVGKAPSAPDEKK